ncbi:hypothetical protein LINGRAHAP2_LOCUS32558 [Linum grandiflorum]
MHTVMRIGAGAHSPVDLQQNIS